MVVLLSGLYAGRNPHIFLNRPGVHYSLYQALLPLTESQALYRDQKREVMKVPNTI